MHRIGEHPSGNRNMLLSHHNTNGGGVREGSVGPCSEFELSSFLASPNIKHTIDMLELQEIGANSMMQLQFVQICNPKWT